MGPVDGKSGSIKIKQLFIFWGKENKRKAPNPTTLTSLLTQHQIVMEI
jgi:hypothetical protein